MLPSADRDVWLYLTGNFKEEKNNRCYAIFVNIYFSIYTCFHMHGMHDIHRAAKCIDVYSGLHLLLFLKLQFEEKPRKLLFLHLWACFCFLFTVEIPQTFLQARTSRPGLCEPHSMGNLSSTLTRLLRIKMLCQVSTSCIRTKNLSQDSTRPQLGIPQGKQCLALIQPISTSPLWVAHKTACLKSVATASRDQCSHGNHSFSIVTLHLIHKTCSCLHCKKYFLFLSRFPVQIFKNYYIKINRIVVLVLKKLRKQALISFCFR